MIAKPMKTLELHYPMIQFLRTKNRLVCKNAVALAYNGSCRLLVMGSCRAGGMYGRILTDVVSTDRTQ